MPQAREQRAAEPERNSGGRSQMTDEQRDALDGLVAAFKVAGRAFAGSDDARLTANITRDHAYYRRRLSLGPLEVVAGDPPRELRDRREIAASPSGHPSTPGSTPPARTGLQLVP